MEQEHYFDDDSIVGQYIKEKVKEFREKNGNISPDEFYEILHIVADTAMEYH